MHTSAPIIYNSLFQKSTLLTAANVIVGRCINWLNIYDVEGMNDGELLGFVWTSPKYFIGT